MNIGFIKLNLFLVFLFSALFISSALLLFFLLVSSFIFFEGDISYMLDSESNLVELCLFVIFIVSVFLSAMASLKIVFLIIQKSKVIKNHDIEKIIGKDLYQLFLQN